MNQKGFVKDLVIVILGVVILVGGYFVFFKKTANAPAETSNQNQTTAGEATTIYHITDLALSFTLPDTLSDLTHRYHKFPNDQAVNSVEFSSKRLESAGCGLETAPLGYLTFDAGRGGILIEHLKNDLDKLYYIRPNGQCKADKSLQDWQTLENALKTLTNDSQK